jgi:hypothetical protein
LLGDETGWPDVAVVCAGEQTATSRARLMQPILDVFIKTRHLVL